MIFTCDKVRICRDHCEHKDFAEKYYPQVWRFLSKTRRACPCAVGDVLTLLSKNMFHKIQ